MEVSALVPFDSGVALRQQAICVLGMHRSGTSVTAQLLQLLGADMGDREELELGGSDNPDGFWERRTIHSIHERILEALGSSWDSTVRLQPDWLHSDVIAPFRKELREFVYTNFGSSPLWAWKDPRTALLLPLWREILSECDVDLKCLIVSRHPLEVARSLERRNGFSVEFSLAVWLNYNLAIIENSAGLARTLVPYGELIADWQRCLHRSFEQLSLPWTGDEEQTKRAIDSAVKKDLRHSHYNAGDFSTYHPAIQRLMLDTDDAAKAGDVDLLEGRLRQTALLDFRLQLDGNRGKRSSPILEHRHD